MVLAERNSEIMRNGRRSRGPSPNGHGGTPDSSSDDDNSIKKNGSKSKTKQSEYEEKIRVGRDYQAVCPELVPAPERKIELLNDRALLVWSPTKDIPDNKLEEYISVAKEKYGYNGEQALGMLFWHKHDLERAVMDLANFTPFPDEWTVEDKVLFEQAFQFHGKSFHRIRQMLPDKSIASLVKYYYSWKKTRHRQSVMDRQEKAKVKDGSDNGSDNGSNDESDNEEKDQLLSTTTPHDTKSIGENSKNKTNILSSTTTKRQQAGQQQQTNVSSTTNLNSGTSLLSGTTSAANTAAAAAAATAASGGVGGGTAGSSSNANIASTTSVTNVSGNNIAISATNISSSASSSSGCCTGCGVSCNHLNTTPHGKLCNSCYHHWRRTGTKRPTTGPYFGKRYRDRNADRHKRKPPRGMHINHDDIVALASSNSNQDELLANTEREIISLLSQVQQNKQNISSLKRKISESSEDLRPHEANSRINSRWTNEELLLAVHGVRKFGKDFQAIAETMGTKTEAHVRTFFVNYRRRYNLDNVLKEFEAEREAQQQAAKLDNVSSLAVGNIETTDLTINGDQQQQKQQSENLIMQIDLESDPSLEPSPVKKPALSVNQDVAKANV